MDLHAHYSIFFFNLFVDYKQIALEVAENGFRPTINGEMEEQMDVLIDLIKRSWDPNPTVRPDFGDITSTLRIIHKRLISNDIS